MILYKDMSVLDKSYCFFATIKFMFMLLKNHNIERCYDFLNRNVKKYMEIYGIIWFI